MISDGGSIIQNIDLVNYFIDLEVASNNKIPGEYAINLFETQAIAEGGWAYALGTFTVTMAGTLTVNNDLSYNFNGTVYGGYDILDYDQKAAGDRSGLAEFLTGLGRGLTGSNSNYVLLVGLEKVTAAGNFFPPNSPPQCFPADTPIQLASGEFAPIQSIRPSDNVATYADAHFRGRGELESRPVVRVFENITDVFVRLSNNLTVTPGHHFLDSKGKFRSIEAILADNAMIVLQNGSTAQVSGEYIHYSAETADMFEQAEGKVLTPANNNAEPIKLESAKKQRRAA